MPSSSSSGSPTAHHRLTPQSPASHNTPDSPSSVGSDEDLDVHNPEDGFELRPLNQDGEERDQLLGKDDDGDGDEVDEEVLYDMFNPGDRRRRRRRRTEQEARGLMYTNTEERAVVKKLDRYLVGALAVLYMLSFLDRSNIGNAKIAGMVEDLDLSGDRYESVLMAFYVTYIAFEWMTLLWKVFPAHSYVAWTVVGWGAVASLQALSVNWWSLGILRALLGIAEAAFGPGVPFYLSLFYRREELALRTGLFISAAPLATAYAGFLAYAITSIPSPIASWRLLFILEGFPSIIAGICAFYMIPDSPGDAWFLDSTQKRIARRRLLVVQDDEEDSRKVIGEEEARGLRWKEIWIALRSPGNWITAFMFFFANVSFASLPVFLPTIVKEMGYISTTAQALSTPPYIFGFFLILLVSYLSDRYRSRSVPLIVLTLCACSGYLLLATAGMLHRDINNLSDTLSEIESEGAWWTEQTKFLAHPSYTTGMQYCGIMLAGGTIFSIISLVIVWNGNNSETETGRGAGMALLQGLGQCGPLVGTRLYPQSQAPEFIQGSLICAASMGIVCLLVMIQRWRLRSENRRREVEETRNVAESGERRIRRFRFML